ncbi:Uncharacterised protein [Klebsiella pneumoniae]|nr:Uncharacterised protein [Klebsiella pneumoniae]
MARERANADYFRWRQLGVSSVVQWRVGRLFAGQSPAGGVRSQPLSASGRQPPVRDGHALERRQLAGRPGYVADERYFPLGMAAE